jgi:DNA-directed RNA polymerase specialized sigma24 family protein
VTADEKADAARSLNEQAASAESDITQLRLERDRLVMDLRSEDGWSYGRIAKHVGLSRGMVALICRPLVRP